MDPEQIEILAAALASADKQFEQGRDLPITPEKLLGHPRAGYFRFVAQYLMGAGLADGRRPRYPMP